MKRLLAGILFIASTMLGCAQNYYNIPATNFAEKVKVIGVAPIIVDADSDIVYPQKDLLLPLVADLNRKYEPMLVRKLQSTGNFYAVTLMADEPKQLFSLMKARREKRDDATIQYNKYFWKNDEIEAYLKKNRLDAVMLVVVSGLNKNSKIFSSNFLMSLETDFNFLMMSAQILGPDGTILWEYPNFRGRLLTYYPMINLQYPDFSESEANLSNKTEVKFKSIDGIRRTLERKKGDWLLRETSEPEIYGKLFDEMISFIKNPDDKQKKNVAAEAKKPANGEIAKTGEVTEKLAPAREVTAPAPASATSQTLPTPQPEPVKPVEIPKANNEVVPVADSPR